MTSLRRKYGFWAAIGKMQFSEVKRLEVVCALIIGIGGGLALARVDTVTARVAVSGDLLAIAGALVGVVFAGFALVIGLMSNEYLRWLDRIGEEPGDGVVAFLSPFLVSVGLQVGTLVAVLGYRASALHLTSGYEKAVFVVALTLFFVAALDIVALARSVMLHGVARARGLRLDDDELADRRIATSQPTDTSPVRRSRP